MDFMACLEHKAATYQLACQQGRLFGVSRAGLLAGYISVSYLTDNNNAL